MTVALLGRKVGMTRYYLADGTNVPVTVIEAGPCVVTQVKTTETDGYAAVQLGFGDVRPQRSTMPLIGHDAKANAAPRRWHREFRLGGDAEASSFELGQTLDATVFEGEPFVDVIGVSKGKGFAGPVRRHNFTGLEASHGVKRKHRSPGSLASHGTNLGTGPKVKKGKRMGGHMGADQVTMRNLDVIAIDATRNLLVVKGPVPGPNSGLLEVRSARRLGRQKTARRKELAKAGG